MKNIGKTLLTLGLAIALTVTTISPVTIAKAGNITSTSFNQQEVIEKAKRPEYANTNVNIVAVPKNTYAQTVWVRGVSKNAKISVKSASKNIKTEAEYVGDGYAVIYVWAFKAGNYKVNAAIKQGGKTYKQVITVNASAYKNPIQSLKIGGKSIGVKGLNKKCNMDIKKATGNKKININLKNGYELQSLIYVNQKTGEAVYVDNNSTIEIKKGYALQISYYSTKDWSNGIVALWFK